MSASCSWLRCLLFNWIKTESVQSKHCKSDQHLPVLSDRWVSTTVRSWQLVSAACSSRCRPVGTSTPCSTSSMRRWGGRRGTASASAWSVPFMSAKTRRCSASPPSQRRATRSCRPPPPPSWSPWRRPEFRANGEPPRSPCSRVSRSSDVPWTSALCLRSLTVTSWQHSVSEEDEQKATLTGPHLKSERNGSSGFCLFLQVLAFYAFSATI